MAVGHAAHWLRPLGPVLLPGCFPPPRHHHHQHHHHHHHHRQAYSTRQALLALVHRLIDWCQGNARCLGALSLATCVALAPVHKHDSPRNELELCFAAMWAWRTPAAPTGTGAAARRLPPPRHHRPRACSTRWARQTCRRRCSRRCTPSGRPGRCADGRFGFSVAPCTDHNVSLHHVERGHLLADAQEVQLIWTYRSCTDGRCILQGTVRARR